MAIQNPPIEFTPVRARRGRRVHALAWSGTGKVACGRRAPKGGWRVASPTAAADLDRPFALLSCQGCKEHIVYPVRVA
jgi:hypothetical protein